MDLIVRDTVSGILPRKPENEWKERGPQKFESETESGKKFTFEMPGGLFLEDILIWCTCKNPISGNYIMEKEGTHGVIYKNCGGVIQLG